MLLRECFVDVLKRDGLSEFDKNRLLDDRFKEIRDNWQREYSIRTDTLEGEYRLSQTINHWLGTRGTPEEHAAALQLIDIFAAPQSVTEPVCTDEEQEVEQ